MLHTKFRGNRSAASGEFLKVFFYDIWALQSSCDTKAMNKLSFSYPSRLHINFGLDLPSGFGGDV